VQSRVDLMKYFAPTSQASLFKLMLDIARGGSRDSNQSFDWPSCVSHRAVLPCGHFLSPSFERFA